MTSGYDVKAHLDDVQHHSNVAMACIWGATRGTAGADRWDMAAADLEAAAVALDAARAALAAMDKQEPYCTACGQPVLSLMAGWSHVDLADFAAIRAGHELELGWRPITEAGE